VIEANYGLFDYAKHGTMSGRCRLVAGPLDRAEIGVPSSPNRKGDSSRTVCRLKRLCDMQFQDGMETIKIM
jgi:hypothetical protein